MSAYESWGRYPKASSQKAKVIRWRDEVASAVREGKVLPYGRGLSQGDSCLNEGGVLLDTQGLNHFIAFNEAIGLLRVEAGVTLAEILEVIVPHGWFLPVTPGTKYITVGGAIANDVHGKNHVLAGTFGRYVTQFELVRSDGTYLCRPTSNPELYKATIGGLGLTGLVTWAEIQLRRIENPNIDVEYVPGRDLRALVTLITESTAEYRIGQFDAVMLGGKTGRGIFMVGNHAGPSTPLKNPTRVRPVPFDAPSWALNPFDMKAYNWLYYASHARAGKRQMHYDPYFYPLDSVKNWNRLYGKRGFIQYQCVVPPASAADIFEDMLARMAKQKISSYLTSLKIFGDLPSPGMLSFPMPGLCIALDIPMTGEKLLKLLDEFDTLVTNAGGRVYPAKDARMSATSFQQFYTKWQEFSKYIDPNFSSSFWRRVVA